MPVRGSVPRHKTAIRRTDLSRPVRRAIEDGLFPAGCRVLDYGCGRGDDARRLKGRGYHVLAWDPVHRPKGELGSADVVNLGYVVNVIEKPTERDEVLRKAWNFAERLLVVSARLSGDVDDLELQPLADGGLTRLGTFQKFYDQSELKAWVGSVLDVAPVPAAPGVMYVFREEAEREQYLASRYRRRAAAPRLRQSDVLFEQHRGLFDGLVEFLCTRGRLPAEAELPCAPALVEAVGSLKRALQILRRVAEKPEDWDRVREERAQDLLVYLALSKFDGRARYSDLPEAMQLDVRAFFGNYKRACAEADSLLFSLGDVESVDAEIRRSPLGKETGQALYVHRSALEGLSPMLRMYEGCARAFIGEVPDANVVKLARGAASVSYLFYPDFEKEPHPVLAWSVAVNLRSFRVRRTRFWERENRPILHRKELFVPADYPLRPKFERLTKQEERWGLFDDPATIGTEAGWRATLERWGARLAGHRVLRAPEPDQGKQA